MPLYEYACVKCGHRFERIEKVTAPATQKCPKCGDKAERQLAPPALQFKGKGWYVTDYAGKGASAKADSEGSGAKEASSTGKETSKKSSSED